MPASGPTRPTPGAPDGDAMWCTWCGATRSEKLQVHGGACGCLSPKRRSGSGMNAMQRRWVEVAAEDGDGREAQRRHTAHGAREVET